MFIRFQGKCILVQFFIYPSMRVNSMVPNRLVQQTAHVKVIKRLKFTYTCGIYKVQIEMEETGKKERRWVGCDSIIEMLRIKWASKDSSYGWIQPLFPCLLSPQLFLFQVPKRDLRMQRNEEINYNNLSFFLICGNLGKGLPMGRIPLENAANRIFNRLQYYRGQYKSSSGKDG